MLRRVSKTTVLIQIPPLSPVQPSRFPPSPKSNTVTNAVATAGALVAAKNTASASSKESNALTSASARGARMDWRGMGHHLLHQET